MAKFKASFDNLSISGTRSLLPQNTKDFLHDLMGEETKKMFLPAPLDTQRGNIAQFNYLRAAYKKIWDRFFGDGVTSQFIANMLFEQFAINFPKAEKALIEWVCRKANIPLEATLTPQIVELLNGLIEDEIAFADEFKAIVAAQTKTKIGKVLLWINNTLKYIYTFKWLKSSE